MALYIHMLGSWVVLQFSIAIASYCVVQYCECMYGGYWSGLEEMSRYWHTCRYWRVKPTNFNDGVCSVLMSNTLAC